MMHNAGRLGVLDVFRGLSVIAMILVISPGAWELRYGWLNHADWYGWTLADMIFPAFLFCAGVALPLALTHRVAGGADRTQLTQHVLLRATGLVLLGICLNAFPEFDWRTVRLPGVLQRIGLCIALVGVLLVWSAKIRNHTIEFNPTVIVTTACGILLFYWLLLMTVPVPEFGASRFDALGSWPVYLDRIVFGTTHLWPYGTSNGSITYDPEGLLSTLPACFNVLSGAMIGYLYSRGEFNRNIVPILLIGILFMCSGLLLDDICPIVKKIWTSSFALLSTGFAIAAMAALSYAQRLWPKFAQLLYPARVFGTNALLAYSIAALIGPLMDRPFIQTSQGLLSIRRSGFEMLSSLISHSPQASLAYALIVLSFILLLLWPLYRRGRFVRL